MAPKQLEFLEQLALSEPELASDIAELANLYQRKLWHQLSLKVDECFQKQEFNKGDLPIRLYTSFISDFGAKINLLKLAKFAQHVSRSFASPAEASTFLQGVHDHLAEAKLPRSEEPLLFLRMQIAEHKLEVGEVAECKTLMEAGRDTLEKLNDADPSVSASVYYVSGMYYKYKKDFTEFYKASLMYLAFVSTEQLPADFRLALAVDLALAALLGDGLYNFAQLLMHPIARALDGGQFQWLHELLVTFNAGDLHGYDLLCTKYSTQLHGQPALVEHQQKLREKITISCLMELISSLPAEERRISLPVIAERTKLSVDGVEFLLMKALALHLIEGTVDEVDSTVQVSWVQPRILTRPQIQGLKDRLDSWISKVSGISLALEQDSIGVAEA